MTVLSSLFAGLSLALKQPLQSYLRPRDGAWRRAGDQERPLRHLAARRWHAAHGRAEGLRRASPRPCASICPARWRRAAMRSSAGISPIPMRRWSRSSAQPRVLPRHRPRSRARSARHSRRARQALAEADALGGRLPHGLDPHLGADQGGAQAAQGRIRGQRAKELGAVGKTQRFYLRSEVMAARHTAFTSRVLSALRAHDVAAAAIEPHDALRRRARGDVSRNGRLRLAAHACRAIG